MNAKHAKKRSKEKTPNSTTSSQLSEPSDLDKASENTQPGFFVTMKDGKYSVLAATQLNPQEKIALEEKDAKVKPSLLPPQGVIEGARAMQYGAEKYGVGSWLNLNVPESSFLDALERHLLAYKLGAINDMDSGINHLGHIIANAAIILAKYPKE